MTGVDLRQSSIMEKTYFPLDPMKNTATLYRGHSIERLGHGKRVTFATQINEKPWSTTTLTLAKAGIDAWIDGGVEPE
jgi:hypothetical protein